MNGSIEWISAGGGNKNIKLRVGGVELDSHRIEGTTQTNMSFYGLYTAASSAPVTIDLNVTNVSGANTGTVGLTRYNLSPTVSSGINT